MLFNFVPGGFTDRILLEQLDLKSEKNIGIYKPAGKVRKDWLQKKNFLEKNPKKAKKKRSLQLAVCFSSTKWICCL